MVFLELILGSAEVFTVDQRTMAMIKHKLKGKQNSNLIKNALLLASLADYCIYSPPITDSTHNKQEYAISVTLEIINTTSIATTKKCSLANTILRKDPLGIGFNDKWGLDLLSRLLEFDPTRRIDMVEAVNHAYFNGPYKSEYDGSEHATENELLLYESFLATHLTREKIVVAQESEITRQVIIDQYDVVAHQ